MSKKGSVETIVAALKNGGRMWSNRGSNAVWIHSLVTVDENQRERTVMLEDKDVHRALDAKAIKAIGKFGPERTIEYVLSVGT